MSKRDNFIPYGTVALAVTATSGHKEFITQQSISANDVRVVNTGTKTAFVSVGKTAAVAVVPSTEKPNATPVAAGDSIILYKGNSNDSIAAICDGSDATTLYATAGEGNQ